MENTKKTTILILGGGFGGIYTYLYLSKLFKPNEVDIKLLSKDNYFVFKPLLHEIASGSLQPNNIIESVRYLSKHFPLDFKLCEVGKIDTQSQLVYTNVDQQHYDYLVIALGASPSISSIRGAEDNCLKLNSLDDARRIKQKILKTLEDASNIMNLASREGLLTYTIIGSGATGVELMAELADFIFENLDSLYPKINLKKTVQLYLISSSEKILPGFNNKIQASARRSLEKKGVVILDNLRAETVEKNRLLLSNGHYINSNTIIYAGGVMPISLDIYPEVKLTPNSRIALDRHLRVEGVPNVFALGDIASPLDEENNYQPMLAQIAVREAKTVAQNIYNTIKDKQLKTFSYKLQGKLISLGLWMAAGEILGVTIVGKLTWWLWRTIYLFKFPSLPKRLRIAYDWTINLFYKRDASKIDL